MDLILFTDADYNVLACQRSAVAASDAVRTMYENNTTGFVIDSSLPDGVDFETFFKNASRYTTDVDGNLTARVVGPANDLAANRILQNISSEIPLTLARANTVVNLDTL